MNPAISKGSIGLDRLATCNEVCCAMALPSPGAGELGCAGDAGSEIQAKFNNSNHILDEDHACICNCPISRPCTTLLKDALGV